MSRISKDKNAAQRIFTKVGRNALDDRANVLPDHKVRQAGAKRVGALLLLGASTLGVGVNEVGRALDHQIKQNQETSHEIKHTLDEINAQNAQQEVQNYVVEHPGASEAEINAYLESDQNPSQPGVQTEQSDN